MEGRLKLLATSPTGSSRAAILQGGSVEVWKRGLPLVCLRLLPPPCSLLSILTSTQAIEPLKAHVIKSSNDPLTFCREVSSFAAAPSFASSSSPLLAPSFAPQHIKQQANR